MSSYDLLQVAHWCRVVLVADRCGLAEVIVRELFGNEVSRRVLSFAEWRFFVADDGRLVVRPLPTKNYLLELI